MLRDYQQSAIDAAITWLKYKPDKAALISMPTGSGKSHVIAALAKWGYETALKNVLILAHRKELLEQTGEKIDLPAGVLHFYSASMGTKELTDNGVTIAAIQSIARAPTLPEYGLILIDECHLVPNDEDKSEGQYWSLLARCPGAMIVGLTATPWRLKAGKLSWGDVIYEVGYTPLMAAGYLSPLSNKLLKDVTPNLESVEIKLGEYVQSQISYIMEDPELLAASVRAIIHYSQGRKSCLVFTVSVNHAFLVAQALMSIDPPIRTGRVEVVTGETPQWERDLLIDAFRQGEIRYLINCELLLVGFDAPRVDGIFCLRPTKSKVLWEQMCGRGVRIAEGKINCILVDMAGNLKEHGGLGTPYRERSRKEATPIYGKICPECEEYVKPVTARACSECSYEFPEPETPKVNHNRTADMNSAPVYGGVPAAPVVYDVSGITYKEKKSKNGNPMIVVSYGCDYGKYGSIAEFLLPYHSSDFVVGKVRQFFKERGVRLATTMPPMDELLTIAETELKRPIRITIDHSGEHPRITKYEWEATKVLAPEEYLDDDIPLFLGYTGAD